ncbi:AraC family transcriptional regulator [Amycolatopsis sp. AA4]|uniref:AraC family transcriptional regulator n=1 Tax=Actinomycetes TaxID=1760 RepID=UPI0001B55AC3|nr:MULTISPECIES: AraC family transcriptional regulator [Actinomycetes]ATY11657.1 AraC family transcriptional regulator [Amycolatopsis sp. AA4]
MNRVAGIAELVRMRGQRIVSAADDVDQVVGACSSALRPHTLRVRDRLSARLDHLAAGSVSVNRLRYGAAVRISELAPEQDEFLLSLPVAGRARFAYGTASAVLRPGTASVVSPYRAFQLDFDDEFEQVVLRLDRPLVERTAALLAGRPGPVAVQFDLRADTVSPGVLALVEAAIHLSAEGARPGHLEALLAETLLLGHPNTLSETLAADGKPPSSARVRRAMDYLRAHLAESFSMAEVARHCGVSLRSLQIGFRRETGRTLSEWLREQRLDRARALLAAADPASTTVTATAIACGFVHLGDFAAQFKRRFGESPSAVLRETDDGGSRRR